MAKSARASGVKKNKQALKKKVFGPVETARNERQNAKLLELAKTPKQEMEIEQEPATEDSTTSKDSEPSKDLDMDGANKAATKEPKSKREVQRIRAARAERVEKSRHRKPRNQVAFPKKRGSKR